MFAVLTGLRGERRGVVAVDCVVPGSSGAWVSWSERRISRASASVSGGTISVSLISGDATLTSGGLTRSSGGMTRETLRWSHGVGDISG